MNRHDLRPPSSGAFATFRTGRREGHCPAGLRRATFKP